MRSIFRNLIFIASFIFILQSPVVYAQNQFQIEDAKTFLLKKTDKASSLNIKLPFRNILVKDYRFDTTKLGYIRKHKIVTENNYSSYFTREANEYFKNNLNPSSDKSLVIIVKTFWIQKGNVDDLLIASGFSNDIFNQRVCLANFDAFSFSEGNYQALSRIETTFSSTYSPRKLADLIFLPFDSLLKKIASLNVEGILASKRKITEDQLSTTYTKRFNIPILTQSQSKKGIFMTFEDFENNNPQSPDFIIRQSKLSTELYLVKGALEELMTDYWGIYDGNDYFIRLGFNLFKLHRQNNTFDVYGSKYLTDLGDLQNTIIRKTPLQLDMEMGEIY